MKPICPSCHQEIPVEDVNLETGWGRCRFCNEIFEIPELVERLRQVQAGEEKKATAPPVRPADSRIRMVRKEDKLLIYLPPWGLRGPVIALFFFSVFWLVFVAFWTVGALGVFFNPGKAPRWENVVFALFSIPFWLIGLGMLGGALAGMLSHRIVYLDSSWLESRWQCLFLKFRKQISREEVQMARVAGPRTFRSTSHDQPNPTFGIEIVYQGGKVSVPCENLAEQEWLLAEVNQFLETVPYRPGYLGEEPADAIRELSWER
ncbi:MAG: hypothetical protein ACUVQG_01200 [Thermogutta sp.]